MRRLTGRDKVKLERTQVENYTTDELFRIRDKLEDNRKIKQEIYKTMLRKRSPKRRPSRDREMSLSDSEEAYHPESKSFQPIGIFPILLDGKL